jgi:hypothetical protein
MSRRLVHAAQGRGFTPPRFSRAVFRFARLLGRTYLRLAIGVSRLQVSDMAVLHQAMERFRSGLTRLIIVFRHCAVADGPVVMQTIANELPRWCRRNKALTDLYHTHFLYGKDVLNWGGVGARWAFPRLGGIPVTNTRADKASHLAMRRALMESPFPLALAPEGQVTYHMFRSYSFSPGAAQLAIWAQAELSRAHSDRSVEILPLAIGYEHGSRQEEILRRLLVRLEKSVGLPDAPIERRDPQTTLSIITEVLIGQLERRLGFGATPADHAGSRSLQSRIDGLVDQVLRIGETSAGLPHAGTIIDRVYRLRYWIQESLYPERVDLSLLPGPERELVDRRAAMATAIKPYERLADLMEYLEVDYCTDSSIRLTECALNLLDLVGRISGGDISERFAPGGATAHVILEEPIRVADVVKRSGGRRIAAASINELIRQHFNTAISRLERELAG